MNVCDVVAPAGTYDAVVSQPSHPWLAGSSALYTEEFFREVQQSLRPGGVLVQWVNLFRMDIASLRSVVATLLDAPELEPELEPTGPVAVVVK